MNRAILTCGLAAMLIARPSVSMTATAAYDVPSSVIACGSGASSGGAFELRGTIGQADAGPPISGGTAQVFGGFWHMVEPASQCPADVALPHDGVVNIDDLLFVISEWGLTNSPADVNHDYIVNIDDLLAVIAAWGMCP